MPKSLTELHEERGRLRERIAAQRSVLSRQMAPVQQVLALGDRAVQAGRDAADTLLKHPMALAVVVGALLAVRPKSLWRWGGRGVVLWRGWRWVNRWLPGVLDRWLTSGPKRQR
ncbi:MAG: YqjK family protein [Burkholderiaceae bacterium]|nr:YqjK family protein [Burkholderiaceae bacterium]MDZ4143161.1 YqjK family protein [Burkholderiales bacterium]